MNFHGDVVKAAYKRKQCTAEIKEKRKTVDTSVLLKCLEMLDFVGEP